MLTVVTIVAGRHDHLRMQLRGLAGGIVPPDRHVVVSMGDPQVAAIVGSAGHVVEIGTVDGHLPLAAARNLGARTALAGGADELVFLDVDCIPSPTLVPRYRDAVGTGRDAIFSGAVRYLPPPPSGGYVLDELDTLARPHPARPEPADGAPQALAHDLFWSLSFAVGAETWAALGGFDEAYVGYGAEDTDFATRAAARGIEHLAVSGAGAYHQWHPSPEPPLQHLDDILRNGRRFRDRWGRWPMGDWLAQFDRLGLIRYDEQHDDWTLRSAQLVRDKEGEMR